MVVFPTLLALFSPQGLSADRASFLVLSQYRDPVSHQWGEEIAWTFQVEDPHRITVTRHKNAEPVITISYSPEGPVERVEEHISGLQARGRRAGGDQIMLSWGFPVPYDWLAPHDEGMQEAVIKKRAGGTVFSYRVTREITYVSIDEAMARGMIHEQHAEALRGRALRLITVYRGGSLMVMQLWPDGASWWLYEETPHRRSWPGQFR
jgi:hypothetical protein